MTTLCIVGLGLMGGSLALALKEAEREDVGPDADPEGFFRPSRIVGVARRQATLDAATAAGAIDTGTTDLAIGLREADVVVLATPVRAILAALGQVGLLAQPGALILDMGSSKAEICRAMLALPPGLQPVGGHPMCGKEKAGFEAASADLYRDRIFALCPLERTSPHATSRAAALARSVGARPILLSPAEHDRAVAGISHLPYTLAVALVNAVEAQGDATAWTLAASGFRDTTRLAASDVDMMLDTLLTNRDALLPWLDAMSEGLAGLRSALAEEDEVTLRALLEQAQRRRARLTLP